MMFLHSIAHRSILLNNNKKSRRPGRRAQRRVRHPRLLQPPPPPRPDAERHVCSAAAGAGQAEPAGIWRRRPGGRAALEARRGHGPRPARLEAGALGPCRLAPGTARRSLGEVAREPREGNLEPEGRRARGARRRGLGRGERRRGAASRGRSKGGDGSSRRCSALAAGPLSSACRWSWGCCSFAGAAKDQTESEARGREEKLKSVTCFPPYTHEKLYHTRCKLENNWLKKESSSRLLLGARESGARSVFCISRRARLKSRRKDFFVALTNDRPQSIELTFSMGSNPTRRGRRRGLLGPSLPWSRALVVLSIWILAAASRNAVEVAAAADDTSSGARASSSSTSTSSTSSSSFLPRDWGKKNIDAELAALAPTTPVLIEFYAHWCPTCQRFAPEFEKAAKSLLEKKKSEALFDIAVARVDCADEATTCVRFGVPHFPFIRFGSAADFLAEQSPALETFDGARNGKAVAAWGERKARELIAKNSGNGGGLSTGLVEGSLAAHPPPPPPALQKDEEDEKEEERPTHNEDHSREGVPPPPPPHPPRFDEGDVLKATVLAFRYSLDSGAVAAARGGAEAAASLAALGEFAMLLSRAHPLPACRVGSAEMLAAIRKLQSEKKKKAGGESLLSLDSLRGVAVCGAEGRRAEAAAWGSCASARADGRGRGYTCGLWSLFHAAAANLPAAEAGRGGDKEGPAISQPPGQLWASAVRNWVRNFFTCSECASHFESMASAEQGGSSAVRTADEASLWAWRAHNRVNARLREEARGNGSSGDGVHRKEQWPPRELCPRCRRGKEEENDDWDEGEILAFLKRYYGGGESGGGGGKTSTSSLGRRVDPGGGAKKKKKETNPSLVSLASSSSSKPASSSSSTTSTALVLLVVFAFVAFGIAAGARAAPRAKKNFL